MGVRRFGRRLGLVSQFRWDPGSYRSLMCTEVPQYDRFQRELVAATRGIVAEAILELGSGSGETTWRVLEAHPAAELVGLDASEEMLAAARQGLVNRRATLRLGRLEDALPAGPFDLVVSALTVHHLGGSGKVDLFARVARVLRPGGRFVLADVVVPDDPVEAITPLAPDYDTPSTVEDQLRWLRGAGLEARVAWRDRDLAVLVAGLPAEAAHAQHMRYGATHAEDDPDPQRAG